MCLGYTVDNTFFLLQIGKNFNIAWPTLHVDEITGMDSSLLFLCIICTIPSYECASYYYEPLTAVVPFAPSGKKISYFKQIQFFIVSIQSMLHVVNYL